MSCLASLSLSMGRLQFWFSGCQASCSGDSTVIPRGRELCVCQCGDLSLMLLFEITAKKSCSGQRAALDMRLSYPNQEHELQTASRSAVQDAVK